MKHIKPMKEKIIVTGGNGFIGSHMCRLLMEQNFEVTIIDDFSTSPPQKTHPYFTHFHQGDIADPSIWQELHKNGPYLAVFHFAARALVGESEQLEKTWEYFHNNVTKTIDLLQHVTAQHIPYFIFSSSCATFGIPENSTISESDPQRPINTYGTSKYMCEILLRDFARKKMLSCATLRYFNAAGCSADSSIGENHTPETHLIPNLILSALSPSTSTFNLFGTNFKTPDGSCIRDYIHVEDLVQAHLQALQYLQKSTMGFYDFNLGSEIGTSNLQMIHQLEKIIGQKINVSTQPARIGDPPMLVSATTKAKKELGFQLKYNISDCLRHTLQYFKTKRSMFIKTDLK